MSEAHCFLVCSEEYGEVIPILDDGTGPTEYGRDVLYVQTTTRRKAKILALRAWRRHYRGKRRRPPYLEDGCPFRGMTVEVMDRSRHE